MYLPLHFQQDSLMYLRSRGFEYNEFEVITLNYNELLEQQGLITCSAKDISISEIPEENENDLDTEHFKFFSCCLKVVKTSVRTRNNDDIDDLTLIFKSPLQLENMLPHTAQFCLANRGKKWHHKLQPGEIVQVNDINLIDSILLRVTIENYKMKRFMVLHRGSGQKISQKSDIKKQIIYDKSRKFRRELGSSIVTKNISLIDTDNSKCQNIIC